MIADFGKKTISWDRRIDAITATDWKVRAILKPHLHLFYILPSPYPNILRDILVGDAWIYAYECTKEVENVSSGWQRIRKCAFFLKGDNAKIERQNDECVCIRFKDNNRKAIWSIKCQWESFRGFQNTKVCAMRIQARFK